MDSIVSYSHDPSVEGLILTAVTWICNHSRIYRDPKLIFGIMCHWVAFSEIRTVKINENVFSFILIPTWVCLAQLLNVFVHLAKNPLTFWSSGNNFSIPVFMWGYNYTVKLLLLWSWSKLSTQACQIKIHARHEWLVLPVVLEQVWTRISKTGKEVFSCFSPSNTPRMNAQEVWEKAELLMIHWNSGCIFQSAFSCHLPGI